MSAVALGDSVYFHFGTASASTGAATNADSTPTVTVAEDGSDLVYSPTVTNVATGLYKVQIDATGGNGFEAGKRYSVYVSATVGSVVGRDGIAEFEVLTTALDTVSSRVDAALSSIPASVWAVVVEGSYTAIQYMRGFAGVLLSKISGGGSGTETFRDTGDSKNRVTASVDSSGNRTSVTLDLT